MVASPVSFAQDIKDGIASSKKSETLRDICFRIFMNETSCDPKTSQVDSTKLVKLQFSLKLLDNATYEFHLPGPIPEFKFETIKTESMRDFVDRLPQDFQKFCTELNLFSMAASTIPIDCISYEARFVCDAFCLWTIAIDGGHLNQGESR